MAPPDPSYPVTAKPEYSNAAQAGENDLKTNRMKIIDILKENMKEALKEIKEKANKQTKMEEINKSHNAKKAKRNQTGEWHKSMLGNGN